MQRYIVKRLIQAVITLFFVSVIVFILGRLTGDPVALLLTETSTEEDRILLTKQLGLDKPLPEQYGIFIWNAIRGDLGRSVRGDRAPALELVLDRLPASVELAAVALIVTLLFGLPLGVLSAIKKGSILDVIGRMFALLGQSAPPFWIGIVAMYVFGVQLGLLPCAGYGRPEQFVLPVLAMSWFQTAAIMRLTRSSMLEVLDSEYIKLARIKGLSEAIVIWKHALRNSLLPVLTYSGTILGRMITAVVVIETVFAWPGIGRLAYEAVMQRDFPVVQAVVLVMAALFLFINLVVDILYAYIDPRIRYS
jgi:peptide/nickel transport system permease protein